MRHTVHLMLSDRSERVLKDIKRYVVKYGSEEENMFFNAMLYREEAEGANFYNSLLKLNALAGKPCATRISKYLRCCVKMGRLIK